MKVRITNEIHDCKHEWEQQSGFYVAVCISDEEPNYYPPAGLVQLEVCPRCGAMRLPNDAESWRGLRI